MPIKSVVKRLSKNTCICAFFVLSAFALYAIPGVADFLPTESGEYVYYRDSTFAHSVYIGFLQYDESNYEMRYYAPEAHSGSKEITLFFTLDAKKDYVHMTGEKIVQTLQNEDTATLNYLHDLFYEFSAQRKKVAPKKLGKKSPVPQMLTQRADIPLFGEPVDIVYDYSVPLFNIREIKTQNGSRRFTALTAGKLTDSEDTAFTAFAGFPATAADGMGLTAFTPIAQELNAASLFGRTAAAAATEETAYMDGEYKAVADNLGFWGSEALLYDTVMEVPAGSFKGKKYGYRHVLARSLFYTAAGIYAYAETRQISEAAGFLTAVSLSYDSQSGMQFVNVKIVKEKKNGSFALAGFSSGIDYYNEHKTYFMQKLREAARALQ